MRPETGTGPPLALVAAVTGSFGSPSGRAGTFTGSYRLERFVSQYGQLAAAGVFTGELTDADGSRVGMGARRQTSAVEIVAANGTALLRWIRPLHVNLLGFPVIVNELSMDVQQTFRACALREVLRLLEPPVTTGRRPPSAQDLPGGVSAGPAPTADTRSFGDSRAPQATDTVTIPAGRAEA